MFPQFRERNFQIGGRTGGVRETLCENARKSARTSLPKRCRANVFAMRFCEFVFVKKMNLRDGVRENLNSAASKPSSREFRLAKKTAQTMKRVPFLWENPEAQTRARQIFRARPSVGFIS